MVKSVFISTDMVEVEHRADFWREATKPVFDTSPVPGESHASLQGSIRTRPVGSLLIGSTSFNGQRYNRDRRIIVQGGLNNYLVQVLTSGTLRGDFNGINVNADAGDIVILDLAQTIRSEVGAGSRLSAAIPRSDLEKAVGSRNLHGTVLRAEWPMTRLITTLLGGIVSLDVPLAEMQALAVQESVVTLLSAALKGETTDGAGDNSALSLALRQRILAFIEQNINLPELSPEFLQRRFNVSRSHLYRAFAADGGVAQVLREKRLDAAFRELTKADGSSRSIAEIAYSLGFSSGNQLLRSFRARFGISPSEAKEEGVASQRMTQQPPNLLAYFRDIRSRTIKP